MMDPQLFEMFNQRMDAQDEVLRDIRATGQAMLTKLDETHTKMVQHDTALGWIKKIQWAAWTAIAALFGERISH